MRHVAAVLITTASAGAHAQAATDLMTGLPAVAGAPEATFEQRIDPWSRWSVRLYAEPGGDVIARGGMEARFLTRRFSAHQLQAGAAVAFSPLDASPVEPWQAVDERGSSLFVEDRLHWSSGVSLTAGARLVQSHGDAAFHQRVALGWQPASAWTLNLTDGALQPVSTSSSAPTGPQRFRGVELQTQQVAGSLRVHARAAAQQVSGLQPTQFVRAAAVTLAMPLDARWSLGSETLWATQGDLTRLRLAGAWPRERTTFTLLVPYRFQGRAIDPALTANLPSIDPDDGLGWRAQLELRF